MNRLMHINAFRGGAGLTGIDIFGFSQLSGRSLKITTGKDNEWVFAWTLEDKFLTMTFN